MPVSLDIGRPRNGRLLHRRAQDVDVPVAVRLEAGFDLSGQDGHGVLAHRLNGQREVSLAGRAGSRSATSLGMPVSRSTLLRWIRSLPDPPIGPVTVLGVDEFAWRHGREYGTVLVDLGDGSRPMDSWTAGTPGTSPTGCVPPGVKVICRDRASGYADCSRQGAPDARQVADPVAGLAGVVHVAPPDVQELRWLDLKIIGKPSPARR